MDRAGCSSNRWPHHWEPVGLVKEGKGSAAYCVRCLELAWVRNEDYERSREVYGLRGVGLG
jgi:hypothetical protein